MKTTIKTLKAMLLLTVMTAWAVVSCAPEIETTSRDWGQVTSGENTTLVSEDGSDMAPTFSLDKYHAEVTITFPAKADILRESNENIASKMSTFLKFYSYTKGPTAADADTLGRAYNYSLVRRQPADNGGQITVALSDYSGDSLVAHVLASTYTFANGKKLGGSGDTQAGVPYYDVYETLERHTQSGNFASPYKRWTITVGLNFVKDSAGSFEYARIVTSTNINTTFTDNVMIELESKLKFTLKQLNGNTWQIINGIFRYDTDTDTINLINFHPLDKTTYRVEVSGIENLTINGYYGVTQRVKVSDGSGTTAFNKKTVGVERTYLQDGYIQAPSNIIKGVYLDTIEKGDKNAVLKVEFNAVNASYPRSIGLGEFKKNVKIFLNTGGFDNAANLPFFDITDVNYSGSGVITITLASDYRFAPGTPLGFLIAPGFVYNDSNVIVGNYNNWKYEIDNVRYFEFYGTHFISNYVTGQ